MNDNEASKLYRRIFTADPSYPEWLRKNSPDPAGTLRTWRGMLADIPQEVAERVVNELEAGTREMPAAYDRGSFGRIMRSWCGRIVDDKRKSEHNAELTRQGTRGAMAAVNEDPLMKATLEKLNDADDAYLAGEMARDRHELVRAAAWAEFRQANGIAGTKRDNFRYEP